MELSYKFNLQYSIGFVEKKFSSYDGPKKLRN